jgi:transcriptional regulator with XRE-family HTH domain
MAESTDNFWKTQREKIDKTQREIADECQYTAALVSSWERDESVPNIARATPLSVAYKVSEHRIVEEIAKQKKRLAERPAQ